MSFPNLARAQQPSSEVIEEVTNIAEKELIEAKIKVEKSKSFWDGRSEVPCQLVGTCCMWIFKRRWYYWVAEGPGLPPDVADKLHETHGKTVRVEGHCACPSPREWNKGFATSMYHVDDAYGLEALANTLKSVYTGK